MDTVDPNNAIEAQTGRCPIVTQMVAKTHDFNANLQKQLLSDYDLKSQIKSQEWAKLIANKKAFVTIVYGQYGDATRTKFSLGTTYVADRNAGNIIKEIKYC